MSDAEDCCKPVVFEGKTSSCLSCGHVGKPIKKITVSTMVKSPEFYLRPESLPACDFYFCETPTCSVVYFSSDNRMLFETSDIRVKVWQKEKNRDDVPACYCFNNSISSIKAEIMKSGKSDVLYRIGKEVKEGNCRCEVTNPQGSCCLGNVAKAVKLAQERLEPTIFIG